MPDLQTICRAKIGFRKVDYRRQVVNQRPQTLEGQSDATPQYELITRGRFVEFYCGLALVDFTHILQGWFSGIWKQSIAPMPVI